MIQPRVFALYELTNNPDHATLLIIDFGRRNGVLLIIDGYSSSQVTIANTYVCWVSIFHVLGHFKTFMEALVCTTRD